MYENELMEILGEPVFKDITERTREEQSWNNLESCHISRTGMFRIWKLKHTSWELWDYSNIDRGVAAVRGGIRSCWGASFDECFEYYRAHFMEADV